MFEKKVLQPVCTDGAETFKLTKTGINIILVAQRAVERSMLGITLRDKWERELSILSGVGLNTLQGFLIVGG